MGGKSPWCFSMPQLLPYLPSIFLVFDFSTLHGISKRIICRESFTSSSCNHSRSWMPINTNQMYHRFRRTFQSHGTSIWDQSLFKAWGSIMHGLIPNLSTIESILNDLVEITGAEEIVLFERTTFLIVTSVQSDVGERNPHKDRFEKLSNILKIFKASLSCVFPTFSICFRD